MAHAKSNLFVFCIRINTVPGIARGMFMLTALLAVFCCCNQLTKQGCFLKQQINYDSDQISHSSIKHDTASGKRMKAHKCFHCLMIHTAFLPEYFPPAFLPLSSWGLLPQRPHITRFIFLQSKYRHITLPLCCRTQQHLN